MGLYSGTIDIITVLIVIIIINTRTIVVVEVLVNAIIFNTDREVTGLWIGFVCLDHF